MASFLQYSLLLLLIPFLLISPASSLQCTSQTFTGSTQYTNCTDLPVLNSYLHWTYDPTNSTLSIAFIAPPAKSDGWIAWAINPTGTGMAGSQALLAYKASNGSMVVKTFNISSYSSIVESKLSFDVVDKKAESSNGLIRILATLALPESMTTVNQVWQVGSSLKDGFPVKHEFNPDNLNAKAQLELVNAQGQNSPAPAPGSAPSPGVTESGPSPRGSAGPIASPSGGCGRALNNGFLGFYGFLLVFGTLVFGF
ncbi:hypothetical protein ACH5RR_010378 [Cinchona calisaya]|uniref:DOMON domain-containing protein n=1 Tax=Cinchona calisaya TaxID=153742 RepID=A0ABD3AIT5_9GENT